MKKNRHIWPVLLLAAAVPVWTAANIEIKHHRRPLVELDEAKIFFEENTTDGDLGIHLMADGEGWKRLLLFSPRNCGKGLLVDIHVRGNLVKIGGLTEIFSESAEPSFDEFPRGKFLAKFPAGEYRFVGLSVEGQWLVGTAELTKHIPDGPVITAPEEEEAVDPNQDLLVEWEAVADPNEPKGSIIEYYEVVVEKDEEDERLAIYRVDMPADATSVRVPAEFLEPGKAYKVEIIAEETSGNRAASEVEFETEEDD
ncbi:MAG: fibronectin type III domain-containing protein [Kiritimatiellales bacterium]|nr:fibronectin type III domain-containing protein [Kiritimatiellales bacterium]